MPEHPEPVRDTLGNFVPIGWIMGGTIHFMPGKNEADLPDWVKFERIEDDADA